MLRFAFLFALLCLEGACLAQPNGEGDRPVAGMATPAAPQVSVISCPDPEYPPAAISKMAQGVTTVAVQVDEDGHPRTVAVSKSSGVSREHKLLDRATIGAVAKCRFTSLKGVDTRTFSLSMNWALPEGKATAVIQASPLVSDIADIRNLPRSFNDTSIPFERRVGEAIKSNLVEPGPVAANSMAEVEISVEPDGKIKSYRLVRSAGSVEWKEAVMRAIARSGRLSLDVNGSAPSKVIVVFRP